MTTTLAPFGSLPAEVARELDSIGPIWGSDIPKHRDLVIAAYTPLVAATPRDAVEAIHEVSYGPHPRQVLDLFVPTGRHQPHGADVVVFIHGGAFVRGRKSLNGLIYDNVPVWFCRQGCIGVNLEYRLADEAPYPGGAEDVGLAVEWLKSNVVRFGGSPDRIFLLGHSAGGTHAATLLFDPRLRDHSSRLVAGAILVSARLQADVRRENPNAHGVRAYFGADAALYPARSPGNYPGGSEVPIMIVTAEFDNPLLDLYGAQFHAALGLERGTMPRFVQMRRHNHTSLVAHFDSGEDYLGREILQFMARTAVPTPL